MINPKYLLLVFLVFSIPIHVLAERIQSFDVVYSINNDGTIHVTETIVYDFESNTRRGIIRELHTAHAQSRILNNQVVLYDDFSVTRNGKFDSHIVSREGGNYIIQIGNENVEITGTHSYELSYQISGALSYGTEGVEFYWNVTGDDWIVPIDRVTARVVSPDEEIFLNEYACYQGAWNSTDPCDKATDELLFIANRLAPGEQLTIGVALDPDRVEKIIHTISFDDTYEKVKYVLIGIIISTIWILSIILWTYRIRTKDKIKGPVIVQYEPYKNYLPMYTGVIDSNSLTPKDITAGIIYLAEQGFLTITRIDSQRLGFFNTTDYELTLTKHTSEIPSQFLQKLLTIFFGENPQINQVVTFSELRATQRTRTQRVINSLQKEIKDELRKKGYIESGIPETATVNKILFIFLFLVLLIWLLSIEYGFFIAISVLVWTIISVTYAFVDRYTKQGREAQHHNKGFKRYLSITDKKRFEFHNAPEKNPQIFMKNLPYAIALGVEDQWSQVFENVTLPNPDWYRNNNMQTFSAPTFTNEINDFSKMLSNSTGNTGSSGGGSAGGGSGGGGGRSW